LANGIETFNVRPRSEGFVSSEIRALFPELGPLTGYAVTALIRAEPAPREGHRASTFAWWDYVQSIPAPRVVVVHDLDDPRGQGAQWGEVQANIHKALGCAGVLTDGSVRDLDEVRALGFQAAARPSSGSTGSRRTTRSGTRSPTRSAGVTGSSPTTSAAGVTATSPRPATASPTTRRTSSACSTASVSTAPSSWATRSAPISACASPRSTPSASP